MPGFPVWRCISLHRKGAHNKLAVRILLFCTACFVQCRQRTHHRAAHFRSPSSSLRLCPSHCLFAFCPPSKVALCTRTFLTTTAEYSWMWRSGSWIKYSISSAPQHVRAQFLFQFWRWFCVCWFVLHWTHTNSEGRHVFFRIYVVDDFDVAGCSSLFLPAEQKKYEKWGKQLK